MAHGDKECSSAFNDVFPYCCSARDSVDCFADLYSRSAELPTIHCTIIMILVSGPLTRIFFPIRVSLMVPHLLWKIFQQTTE